jgi:arsenite/tail-anchored protein-transporting ATPase
MIDALLARASTKFIFVVGKGGVGKTTTAGAVALALADRSLRTHLISTDPAHSLRDLFNHETCSSDLIVEEFDARKYADTLFARLRTPLIELMERGTYLDVADATGFLDLSIPGIDEVMATLRLVELNESDVKHVVVDTAPTGHTVRLFDAPSVIDSWVAAGRAMADKAGAVSAALVGRRVQLEAEPLLDELQRNVRTFYDDVITHAGAIIVTRPGHVVGAETQRLIAELERRALHVSAVVSVGQATEESDFVVEQFKHAPGCAGVREWPTHLTG